MKIAIVTNILTPYRIFFYKKLNEYLLNKNIKFKVYVMSETESNRNWYYDQYKTDFTELLEKKISYNDNIFINKDVKKKLKEFSPNIIIAAGAYQMPTILYLMYLKKKLNFKLIFWSESNLIKKENLTGFKKRLREIIRNTTYKKFDGFWYSGKFSKEFIEKYSRKNTELYFLPNLIDNSLYSNVINIKNNNYDNLIEKYNINKNKTVFICPARLSPQKGILEFLNLLKNCKNKNKASILIAGDGELYDEINSFIIENKDIDVRLIGYKEQDEIIELYSIANFFLLPSIEDPNPLTCIEALWSGLPLLISSHVGNSPEVLINEKNGYLFDYNDIEKSIINIEKAINSDEKWLSNASKISMKIAKDKYFPDKAISECINEMLEK
ncbi:glycosyltransferase family 4 protein [Clostridium perfringens]|uniref:glycosyltransferase family 4 protein n=1 Tax=Clostridium perfringens TaxID=1502 RepID=UPI000D71285E|nr:glycosyltransferase family 4 protein [Clostridium perfringens]EGT2191091.1 glycosyltransferase [Clostridium perfringens]EIF2087115.1 glycosyltransferase family 4 protein [Clostridium perfringens]EIF6154422.1 glycosyltransferase family 4 protein [Clostridium perfringens]EJT5923375.1 glycosyltransferase family 4 protein [Clostridium perfringens]ELC8341967.1 glycosyltransferase family 4 protein [Clostridium perfringens]